MERGPGPRKHTPPISEFLSRIKILRAAGPEPTRITIAERGPGRNDPEADLFLATSHIIADFMHVRRGSAQSVSQQIPITLPFSAGFSIAGDATETSEAPETPADTKR